MANSLLKEISDLKSKYQESLLLINSLTQDVSCQKLKLEKLESLQKNQQSDQDIKYILDKKVFKKKLFALIKEDFEDWCSNSTSHGIPNIVKTKNMFLKVSWFLLFLLSSAICLYSIVPSVIKYLEYDENTGVQEMIDLPAEFPSVTICNLNPYSLLFDEYLDESDIFFEELLSDYDTYTSDYMRYAYDNDSLKFNITLNNTLVNLRWNYLSMQQKNLNYFTLMNFIERNRTKYENILWEKFTQSIISCEFNGISCLNRDDFKIFESIQYSLCFSFNSNKEKIKKIGRSGQINGLNLKLYLDNTFEAFTFLRGLRLFIHNASDQFPTLERNVIAVPPGFQTNIAVKRTLRQKLPKPYTDCLDDLTEKTTFKTDIMNYMFYTLNLTTYSYKICESVVYQMNLNKTCNCLDPNIEFFGWKNYIQIDEDGYEDQTCDSVSNINCLGSFYLNFTTNPNFYISDSCPLECFRIDYSTEISQSQFLTDWYVDFMRNSLKDYIDILDDSSLNPQIPKLAKFFPKNKTANQIRNNLISFNVYYSDLSYTLMSDTPQDDWFTFIANIGGLMGAFIGISIMSFAEVIELVFRLTYIVLTNVLRFNKSKNKVMPF